MIVKKERQLNRTSIVKLFITITVVALLSALSLTGCGGTGAGSSSSGDVQDIDKKAESILKDMTLDEKIGQMILARIPAKDWDKAMENYQFGGYVLYERDFKDEKGNWYNEEEVKAKLKTCRASAKVAPFLAVDEEGGEVRRLSRNTSLFPKELNGSPQEIWKEQGEDALYDITEKRNKRLHDYGLNLNLAPVADVPTKEDSFMYSRSMGADADKTSELIEGVVKVIKKAGMGSVLKHYPGYGDSGDSHENRMIDERSKEEFEENDLKPFKAGIEAGADAVLIGHNVVKSIDQGMPTSLSVEAHRILREDLGFEGVAITDDIYMTKVWKEPVTDDAAILAVYAGNDMLISTFYGQDINSIRTGVEKKDISEEQINEAVLRILKMKLELGVIK